MNTKEIEKAKVTYENAQSRLRLCTELNPGGAYAKYRLTVSREGYSAINLDHDAPEVPAILALLQVFVDRKMAEADAELRNVMQQQLATSEET